VAREETASVFHWLGMWGLVLYLNSGFLSEVGVRTFGGSPHVGVIALAGMFIMFILTGGLFRCLRDKIGRFWLGFLIWMLICIVFSTWRTGSLAMVTDYVPRSYMLLFFLSAFLVDRRQCRVFMLATALSCYSTLLWCFLNGVMDPASGRFIIPQSLFYSNANDLGIQLAISLSGFLYLSMQRALVLRLFGFIGFPVALFYMLKTGSRGAFLACGVFVAVTFLYSRGVAKVAVIAGVAVTLAVAALAIPSSTLSRLVLIFLDPQEEARSEETYTQQEIYSIGSQMARWELVKLSLWCTVTNPLFGVGPGEFIDYVAGEAAKKSQRSGWAGTHNAYTQVSSECGLPGAFCYIAVLWLAIRTAYRLMIQSRGHPALTEMNKMAFALLATTATFAVCALFHHIAYTGHLALLAGQALAYDRATRPLLDPIRTL
jgi:hypothetical protein